MQLKIGIFGDSFGACDLKAEYTEAYTPFLHRAWPVQLLNKFTHVDNYCKAGSGIDFSCYLINQHGHLYNKIIFLVSDPARLYVNEKYQHLSPNQVHYDPHYAPTYSNNTSIQNASIEYYKYFHNNSRAYYKLKCILQDLRIRFANSILILNAFAENEVEQCLPFYDNKMHIGHFSSWENSYVDIPDSFKLCHMTTVHHDILYKKCKQWCLNGEFNLTNDVLKPMSRNKNDYIEWTHGVKRERQVAKILRKEKKC